MSEQIDEIPEMPADGKLYHNRSLDLIEAYIPTRFTSNHACDLLELPNGDLLCAWFAGSDEGNADIRIVLSRLDHKRCQWSEARVISDGDGRSHQNPSVFMTPGGELWLVHTSQQARAADEKQVFNFQYTAVIERKISSDQGITWGATTPLINQPGSFCRQKIQILENGRWLFGNWVCFNDDSRNGSDITQIQISDDQGASWRPVPVPFSQGRVHANIVEISSGNLIALFRSRSADYIYRSESRDNGESWSEPVRTELPNNNSSISAIRLSSGRIGLVYNDYRVNDDPKRTEWPFERIPVTVALSEDAGLSWPYRRHIEMGEGFCGKANIRRNRRYEYPCIIQGKNGMLHVAYSFGNRICMKYVSFSEDWITGDPGASI